MAEHSPEPWKKTGLPVVIASVTPADYKGIADCRTVDVSSDEASANARRIVACVNALAGVPTRFLEKLPPGALADMIEDIVQKGE